MTRLCDARFGGWCSEKVNSSEPMIAPVAAITGGDYLFFKRDETGPYRESH